MKPAPRLHRPVLARGARYRWDKVRREHQVVFPEGVVVLNESAAAIVQLCDGRTTDELISALREQKLETDPTTDVRDFLKRLAEKGLLRDGDS